MVLAHFLYLRLHPRIIEVGLHPDGSLRDRHLWKLAPLAPQTYALRMDADLDFASATALERAVVEHLAASPTCAMSACSRSRSTASTRPASRCSARCARLLQERGITLHISGMKLPVERVLRKAGELEEGPLLHMYRTDAEALLAFGRVGAAETVQEADQAVTIQPSSGSRSSGKP